jgi:hypothetical protein
MRHTSRPTNCFARRAVSAQAAALVTPIPSVQNSAAPREATQTTASINQGVPSTQLTAEAEWGNSALDSRAGATHTAACRIRSTHLELAVWPVRTWRYFSPLEAHMLLAMCRPLEATPSR